MVPAFRANSRIRLPGLFGAEMLRDNLSTAPSMSTTAVFG